MARIQVYDDKKLLDLTTGRAVVILDTFDTPFPKSLAFTGDNGEHVAIHLSPQDVKKLREWALQQSINDL